MMSTSKMLKSTIGREVDWIALPLSLMISPAERVVSSAILHPRLTRCLAANGRGTFQLTHLPRPCSALSACQASEDTTQSKLLDVRKFDVTDTSETPVTKFEAGKTYTFEYSLVRCPSL